MGALRYQVDDDSITVYFDGVPSDAEFEDYLRRLSENLERNKARGKRGYVVIVVADDAVTPSAQRRKQAEWMKRHSQEIETWSAGTAFVFRSAVMRFILSSIMLMQPIPGAYTVVATEEEAREWGNKQRAGDGKTARAT